MVLLADAPASLRPTGIIPYDLEPPARLIMARQEVLDGIFGPRADARRRAAAREAAAEEARNREALATAEEQWKAMRDSLAWNDTTAAVLDLHRPRRGYRSRPECGECMTDDCHEAVAMPWPCRTFEAVTGGDA